MGHPGHPNCPVFASLTSEEKLFIRQLVFDHDGGMEKGKRCSGPRQCVRGMLVFFPASIRLVLMTWHSSQKSLLLNRSAPVALLRPIRQTDQVMEPVHISSCWIWLFRIHPSSPLPLSLRVHSSTTKFLRPLILKIFPWKRYRCGDRNRDQRKPSYNGATTCAHSCVIC
jgi:hypothetical protein